MAGAGGLSGSFGGLPFFLGTGRKPGGRLVGGRSAAGAAAGKAGGKPGSASDDTCPGGLSYGGNGADLSADAETGGTGNGFFSPGGPDFLLLSPVYPSGPMPGCHYRLADHRPGDLGSGPGQIYALSGAWLHSRGNDGGFRRLPRGSPGRAGAGSGPGDQDAHDGGAVHGLLCPDDSL